MNTQHHEFFSIDDCLIQVGTDAKSNDQLSLHTSRPDEWWMHWEGGAGAHVVICCRDDYIHNVLPETLKDAATLALRHSKAAPVDKKMYVVTLTRPCYLQKPKGAKDGMIKIALTDCFTSRKKGKKKKQQRRQRTEDLDELSGIVEKYSIRYEASRYERLMESHIRYKD